VELVKRRHKEFYGPGYNGAIHITFRTVTMFPFRISDVS